MTTTDIWKEKLKVLEENSNLRELKSNNTPFRLNLSTNDYLGLNANKELRKEFLEKHKIEEINFSSTSSRLLTGNYKENFELEELLSKLYKKECSLVFNSGYHANIGILPAISDKNDIIFADKLVHASIIDGLRLCEAQIFRYNHLNYEHLEKLIDKNKNLAKNIFIVTESIFSMNGDIANLNELCRIKKKYDCFLYVDEAHSVGIRGENGLGLCEEFSKIDEIDFLIGTFGKAIASVGAFVICNNLIKRYLINNSRSFIFTTALPPINLKWTKFIFEKLKDFNYLRENLEKQSSYFAKLLNLEYESNIIPYIVGSNENAMQLSKELQDNGFYVLPIRHPTVPQGTARLRFSLTTNMQKVDLLNLAKFLEKSKIQRMNIIK